MDEQPKRGLYGQRPSNGADAGRREQIAQERAMAPRDRARLALRLGREAKALRLPHSGGSATADLCARYQLGEALEIDPAWTRAMTTAPPRAG